MRKDIGRTREAGEGDVRMVIEGLSRPCKARLRSTEVPEAIEERIDMEGQGELVCACSFGIFVLEEQLFAINRGYLQEAVRSVILLGQGSRGRAVLGRDEESTTPRQGVA